MIRMTESENMRAVKAIMEHFIEVVSSQDAELGKYICDHIEYSVERDAMRWAGDNSKMRTAQKLFNNSTETSGPWSAGIPARLNEPAIWRRAFARSTLTTKTSKKENAQ